MQLMMVSQYTDMLKDVGGTAHSTVFVPNGASAVGSAQAPSPLPPPLVPVPSRLALVCPTADPRPSCCSCLLPLLIVAGTSCRDIQQQMRQGFMEANAIERQQVRPIQGRAMEPEPEPAYGARP